MPRNPSFSRVPGQLLAAVVPVIFSLTTPPVSLAQTVTWTGGGSNAFWDNLSGSPALFRNWSSLALPPGTATVVFGSGFGSGSTVFLNGNRTVAALSVDTSTPFTLSGLPGQSLTLSSGDITRSAASTNTQTINVPISLGSAANWNINGTGGLTLAGPISGNADTEKNGTATLTLGAGSADTAANSFNGQTTVNAGTLLLNKADGINAIAGSDLVLVGAVRLNRPNQISDLTDLAMKGGTIDLADFQESTGSLLGTSGTVTASSSGLAGLNVNQASDASVAVAFTGRASFRKNGLSNLTLTHTATPNTLASLQSGGGTLTVSGGTYSVNGGAALAAELGGTIAFTSGVSLDASAGSFALADSGGTLLFSGAATSVTLPAQTFAGHDSNGTVIVDAATATGGIYLGAASNFTGSSGAVIIRNAAHVSTTVLYAAIGPGTTGTVTITGAGTTVSLASLLAIGGAHEGQFGGTGSVTVSSGAVLTTPKIAFLSSNASLTIDAAAVTTTSLTELAPGTIRLSDPSPALSALTVNTASNVTYTGTIANHSSSTGSLTKAGAGTLTLTNPDNSFTGPLNVDGGTLVTPAIAPALTPSPIGAGLYIRLGSDNATATFRYTGSNASTTRSLVVTGLGGNLESAADLTFNSITATGPFTKRGNGDLNASSITGTLVNLNDGSMRSAALTANTLILSNNTLYTVPLNATAAVNSQLTLNTGSILAVERGTLAAARLSGSGTVAITDPDASTAALAIAGDHSSWTFDGAITNRLPDAPGSLVKNGSGTVTLRGPNTYTGATTINAGTLSLNNSLLGTGGPITVGPGATLQAQGSILRTPTGAGTITATGHLILGDPASTFSFGGTLNVGSNFVTLLTSSSANLGPSTALGIAAQLSSNSNIVVPVGGTLSTSASPVIASNLVNAGAVSASTSGTGFIFRGNASGAGSWSGNLRFEAAFTPTGPVNATQLQIHSTGSANFSSPAPATALVTTNNGQLRVGFGSPNLGLLIGTGTTTVTSGTLTANSVTQSSLTITGGSVTLPNFTGPTRLSLLSDLTLFPAANFDLANTDLLLNYTGPANSPLDRIRQYLASAAGPDTLWQGAAGLTSSAARASYQSPTAPLTALAYAESALYKPLNGTTINSFPLDDDTIVIKYTLLGDANLDGRLTPDDYALLDKGFATGGTYWWEGDFNYDGAVTSADYLLIDRSLHRQTQSLTPAFLSMRQSQFGPDYVSALLTSIPEPSVLLSFILLPLTRRRRP